MHQKYRELEPVITNVMQYDTCVMVDALKKYLALEKRKIKMVETVGETGVGDASRGVWCSTSRGSARSTGRSSRKCGLILTISRQRSRTILDTNSTFNSSAVGLRNKDSH